MNNQVFTTKRVAGSAEVTLDEKGNLQCTNFRAYMRKPRNEAPLNVICDSQGVRVYEYTEHYNVVLRVPKDGTPSVRHFMERLADALAAIEREERK